jgi:Putative metallopeptidase
MSEAPPPPASGRVEIRYEDAHTPEAQRGRELMQNARLLEDLAQHVEDSLVLPSDMGAVAKQCDTVNDFYDPNVNEVQLCYEAIQHSEQNFAGSGNPDPAAAAVDEATSAFYHELGHATLAIYDLAFTGREEDVADQLSAFMLLTPGADGKPYPNGVRIATNTAQDWKLSAKEAGDASELPFWDGHPMDIQRMYNWECWIYGSGPAANASIVTSGDLPEDRAGNCEGEFENMSRGWQQLLGPHLRKPN